MGLLERPADFDDSAALVGLLVGAEDPAGADDVPLVLEVDPVGFEAVPAALAFAAVMRRSKEECLP